MSFVFQIPPHGFKLGLLAGCVFALPFRLFAEEPAPLPASVSAHELLTRLDADVFEGIAMLEADGWAPGDILELRIMRHAVFGQDRELLTLLPELERVELPVGRERLFASEAERSVFIDALRAKSAYELADIAAFEMAYANLRPDSSWVAVFDLADNARDLRARHGGQTVALDSVLRTMEGGEVVLGDVMAGNKGLLLDFWASWCGPCIRAMPELKEKAARWSPQGLLVAGVNTDSRDQEQHARRIAETHELDLPWWLEPPHDPLSGPLEIDSIPRMVLIDPTGQVRFNGHPSDPELPEALLAIGVKP